MFSAIARKKVKISVSHETVDKSDIITDNELISTFNPKILSIDQNSIQSFDKRIKFQAKEPVRTSLSLVEFVICHPNPRFNINNSSLVP